MRKLELGEVLEVVNEDFKEIGVMELQAFEDGEDFEVTITFLISENDDEKLILAETEDGVFLAILELDEGDGEAVTVEVKMVNTVDK